jgi:hypothetical protein
MEFQSKHYYWEETAYCFSAGTEIKKERIILYLLS